MPHLGHLAVIIVTDFVEGFVTLVGAAPVAIAMSDEGVHTADNNGFTLKFHLKKKYSVRSPAFAIFCY